MNYLPIYIIHSLQSCAAKLFISFGRYSLLSLEKNLNEYKMNIHGLLKLGIHIWSLSFSFSLSLLLSMLLSLSFMYTTQELLPRCEANQAGGEDQLVGVGRCQRDRLDQGAGGGS